MGLRTTILFLLAAVVAGCSSRVAPTTTTTVKDSIYVKEIVRHDTVSIPGEKIRITRFIHCDSLTHQVKPFEVKEKKNNQSLEIILNPNGELTAICKSDSLIKVIEGKDKEINHLRQEKTKETIPVITHEPYWYDIAARWIASIVLLLIAGYLIYSYFKFKIKPI